MVIDFREASKEAARKRLQKNLALYKKLVSMGVKPEAIWSSHPYFRVPEIKTKYADVIDLSKRNTWPKGEDK